MKTLPHRLRDGRCRDCGHHDSKSAPDTCPRCTIDVLTEDGYRVELDPGRQFFAGAEMWHVVAYDLKSGAIKSGRFYVYVGLDDGESLTLPLGELSPEQWTVPHARTAKAVAQALTERYAQVWIVTTVGCWNVRPPTDERNRR
jgi:hypothetical protein